MHRRRYRVEVNDPHLASGYVLQPVVGEPHTCPQKAVA